MPIGRPRAQFDEDMLALEKEMTTQEKLFCFYYLNSKHGTMSAISADYAEQSAAQEAFRLLNKPKIQRYLNLFAQPELY